MRSKKLTGAKKIETFKEEGLIRHVKWWWIRQAKYNNCPLSEKYHNKKQFSSSMKVILEQLSFPLSNILEKIYNSTQIS